MSWGGSYAVSSVLWFTESFTHHYVQRRALLSRGITRWRAMCPSSSWTHPINLSFDPTYRLFRRTKCTHLLNGQLRDPSPPTRPISLFRFFAKPLKRTASFLLSDSHHDFHRIYPGQTSLPSPYWLRTWDKALSKVNSLTKNWNCNWHLQRFLHCWPLSSIWCDLKHPTASQYHSTADRLSSRPLFLLPQPYFSITRPHSTCSVITRSPFQDY